jgi:hypothetical protein
MVSHLFYYQLALLAILWLFVMLHVAGSHPGGRLGQSVAAVYTGDGSGINRPCVVAARGVTLSGAAVAPVTDRVKNGVG